MENIRSYLDEKGWKKSDINKATKIIENAKRSRHPKIKLLDKSVYWFSLVLAIMGNFIISITLIPFILALNGVPLYLIVITLGLAFGLLFELLLRTIENLGTKHHLFFGIIIPLLTLINFIIISNNMKQLIGIESPQNLLVVGSVYAIAFILPYISYQFFLKNKY